MIASFFDTPERKALLFQSAQTVIGTPFFANSEAPGELGGMDCVHLLNYVYRSCGVIGPLSWPDKAMDWAQHNEKSILIEAFDTWPELTSNFVLIPSVDIRDLLLGDALMFKMEKVSHHSGVYLGDGDILHTLKKRGAHTIRYDLVLRGKSVLGYLVAAYRPIKH
jgi:cell wall-associated NlpC family hydrolase